MGIPSLGVHEVDSIGGGTIRPLGCCREPTDVRPDLRLEYTVFGCCCALDIELLYCCTRTIRKLTI